MSDQRRKKNPELNTSRSGIGGHVRSAIIGSAVALACLTSPVKADEGGVSFWLPGLFGSLAAAPQQPGWSLSTIYYHTTVSAGADVARAREITIGKIPVNLSANLSANLDARADLAIVNPTYVFATPFLGGQAAVGLMGIYGRTSTSLAGTLSGALTTPFGTIPFLRSDSISDSVTGLRRLVPAVLPALERGRPQLHDLHHRAIYRSGPTTRRACRTSASGTARSTAAAATPISIRRPGMSSRRCSASPTISRISRRSTRTASTCISTGARHSS